MVLACLAMGMGSVQGGSAELDLRLERTQAAVDDLAKRCTAAGQTAPQWVHVVVGRTAIDVAPSLPLLQGARILDHAYETALRSRIALVDAAAATPALPAPVDLKDVSFRGPHCVSGDAVVYPIVVTGALTEDLAPLFAKGVLFRHCPALAGVTAATLDGSEVARVHKEDPSAHRFGWGRPAGGFVRDATPDSPAVLIAIDHPAMRAAIARDTATALAAAPPQTPAPLYLSLGHDVFYTDYSPVSAARFAAWVKARYGKPHVASVVWQIPVPQIGQESMPTPAQASASPSRWYDWTVFNAHRLTRHVRWATANVRRAAPKALVGMSGGPYFLAGSLGLSGLDPLALAASVDVIEVCAATPIDVDLASALAQGDRPVVETALPAGPFGLLPHLLHGAAAVALPSWPLEPIRTVSDIAAASRLLREAVAARRFAAPIAALAAAPKPIAFVYSLASVRQAPPWSHRCSRTPHTRRLADAYEAARFLDVGVRFAVPQGDAEVEIPEAPVYIVAGAPVEREPVIYALLDRVELGAHLVVIAESFVPDERGRESDHLLRLGIEVADTVRPAFTTRPRPDLGGALDDLAPETVPQAVLLPTGPALVRLKTVTGVGVRQKIRVNVRHETLATFANGDEAIVSFSRGKGRITYLAMPIAPRHLRQLLRVVLHLASARPVIAMLGQEAGEGWGVECRSVRQGKTVWVSLWNTTPDLRRVVLVSPPATGARPLGGGKPATASTIGQTTTLGPIHVPPFETLLLRVDLK